MEKEIMKSDWLFLITCLFLGILAEQSFFINVEIGISYIVFLAAFYLVFFVRYRRFSFSHQRFGYLLLICIWLLTASYFTHFTPLFYCLNIMVIPCLVIIHIVLITSAKMIEWNRLPFVTYVFSRLIEAIRYLTVFAASSQKKARKGMDESYFSTIKKVIIGIVISIPVLVIILPLLMSADSKFKQLIGGFPGWFQVINAENIAKLIFILFAAMAFFGVFQVLLQKQLKVVETKAQSQFYFIDEVVAVTILILINLVYILFTFVQFKYFFSGSLQAGYTYAQYARKGFFELLFVTVINLSLTVLFLTFVERKSEKLHRLTKSMMTILVISSGIILCSSFMRLGMYEEAYGFTFTRILAHSFMIFLAVIFAYTLIKIWIEKLSLSHFYIITALGYYTVINTVDIEQIVVTKNIERYEISGKVDVQYLNTLSYTGIIGLISLYEKGHDIPNLKSILMERKSQAIREGNSWQSLNLKKLQAKEALQKLNL